MNGYEIIVTTKEKNGGWRHLFATDTRSCQTIREAKKLYNLLKEKFPEPDYDVAIYRWETTGRQVNI